MDEKKLRALIPKKPLRLNVLKKLSKRHDVSVWVYYSDTWDALTIQFVPPETSVVVRHVKDHISVIYQEDREVVGFLIEDFVQGFLPKHQKMQDAWKLSDSSKASMKNYADLARVARDHNPTIAREAVRASRIVLGKNGILIPATLSNGAIRQVSFQTC